MEKLLVIPWTWSTFFYYYYTKARDAFAMFPLKVKKKTRSFFPKSYVMANLETLISWFQADDGMEKYILGKRVLRLVYHKSSNATTTAARPAQRFSYSKPNVGFFLVRAVGFEKKAISIR